MSHRYHRRTTVAAILVLLFASLAALPRVLHAEEIEDATLVAQSASTGYLSGDVLDGVTVRIRPENSALSLCLKNDGKGSQNVVYLYNIGDSSRFYLEKADSESYYIRFFPEPSSLEPSDTVLDVDKDLFKGYDKDGAAIHEVDKSSENHQRWKLYRYSDRTYAIQNKQTGQWWTLGDTSDMNKSGNELHQSKMPLYWEFEILYAAMGSKLVSAADYSSYAFDNNGTQVTAMNWMSQLPDDLYLSDLSIPGVHDAATCALTPYSIDAKCQQQFIPDLLNAGTRYLDLRCSTFLNGSPKLNHTFDCVERNGSLLTMNDVMRHVQDFFGGPGKNETIIFQISRQGDDADVTQGAVYDYFYDLVHTSTYKDLFYVGPGMPKLSEVRGKIVILSRLNPNAVASESTKGINGYNIYAFGAETNTVRIGNPHIWALDISEWNNVDFNKGDDNYHVLFRDKENGTPISVYVQDRFKTTSQDKWKLVQACLGEAIDHKTWTETKQSTPKHAVGELRAYIINYTSASQLLTLDYPVSVARSINPELKKLDSLAESASGFVGIVCVDFADEQLNQRIYHLNFNRYYSKPTVNFVKGTIHSSVYTSGVKVETDSLTDEFCQELFTDEERQTIETQGAVAHVWLEAKALEPQEVPAADYRAIERFANRNDLTVVRYADISLWKQASADAAPQKIQLAGRNLSLSWRASEGTSAQDTTRAVYILHALPDGTVRAHRLSGDLVSRLEIDHLSTFAVAVEDDTTPTHRHSPSTTSTTETTAASKWSTIAGENRYQTMAAVVTATFDAAEWAVLASGQGFADALAASSLAGTLDCPVVTTATAELTAEAADVLTRLGVRHVLVVGGEASVSGDVLSSLAALGIEATRVAGADRSATSLAVLRQVPVMGTAADTVLVATGTTFADALSVGPYAYLKHAPIVLTSDGTLSDQAVSAIREGGFTRAIVVGGTGSVSPDVETQLAGLAVTRLAGADRYETSVVIASFAAGEGLGFARPVAASGTTFPDALVGAPLAARQGGVLLLVGEGSTAAETLLGANKAAFTSGTVLGGTSSVSQALADRLEAAVA